MSLSRGLFPELSRFLVVALIGPEVVAGCHHALLEQPLRFGRDRRQFGRFMRAAEVGPVRIEGLEVHVPGQVVHSTGSKSEERQQSGQRRAKTGGIAKTK
ncbi:hypothetical protein D3C71_1719200 [compost metagenome]